eukprot:4030949-Lingulodinium_polyedra.AAC.1
MHLAPAVGFGLAQRSDARPQCGKQRWQNSQLCLAMPFNAGRNVVGNWSARQTSPTSIVAGN